MSLQCPFTKQDCVFYGKRHHHEHACGKERDDFAVAYMQALLMSSGVDKNSAKWREILARDAYAMADIMLIARKPPAEETP